MSIKINNATLARQNNGEIEYIYPKTDASLVEYDSTQSVKDKIDSIEAGNAENKVNKPIDADGNTTNGSSGQVLETNGDGTTSWVTRPRIYVGSGEMPEGYDAQINPEGETIEVDETLTIEGKAADSKAVGDAINKLTDTINNIDDADKVNKPLNASGISYDGEAGQVLETNGDGSTSWVTRTRVYVGDGDMPEGYDVQIDPDATAIEIDRTLSIDGAVAEASAVGAAINLAKGKITSDIKTHDTDAAAHTDIRAMITAAKDYILLKDIATGEEYKVYVENGELKCDSTVVRPTSIAVTVVPTKTTYDVGDKFDPTGMVITAKYDDNTTKVVTNYTYPTTGLTGGTSSVTITYIEGGVTVTTTVDVIVVIKCIGISISKAPNKTQYVAGEKFDPTGMVVTATYSDGSTKSVIEYSYNSLPLTEETISITITYAENGEFTAVVPITVIAAFDAAK